VRPAREGDAYVFGQPPAGDVNADDWTVLRVSAAPFLELPLSFFNDRVNILPGVRLDATVIDVSRALPPSGDTPSHGAMQLLAAIEPRISASVRPHERLTLKGAFGIYHAPPDPADLSSVFGNPRLGYTRSLQSVLGATVQVTTDLSAEVVGFHRGMDGVVSRAVGADVQAGQVLVASGTAQAYGIQFTLRERLAHGFTGWITYTLSRSEVVDRPGAAVRLSDYDQTHLFTAVASYELPFGFSVGGRFRIISGLPRTPVVGRTYDTLTDDTQPIFGAVNSIRLPTIYSLDLRVDRRFRIGRGEVVVYLDVINVLDQPPPEEIVYDSTFTQQGYITGFPILADLGLRAEF
jgi:hypothetical protein